MLEIISKLLVLQERDHKIQRAQADLAGVEPQRQMLQAKAEADQAKLEAAKQHLNKLESECKESELEVQGKKQLIEKYSLQQYQTKKNEEYRALTNEIEKCKQSIDQLETKQLELMEQADAAKKEVADQAKAASETKKTVETQLEHLAAHEQNLVKLLEELETSRGQLAEAVEEDTRTRYERLLKNKGQKALASIDRGVCGGCHMTLPPQIIITCQSDQELTNCPNCGRILYCLPDTDVSIPINHK